jgi:hypothetical protein
VCYSEMRNRIKPLKGVTVTVQGRLLILYCHLQPAPVRLPWSYRTLSSCVQSGRFKSCECNICARSNYDGIGFPVLLFSTF